MTPNARARLAGGPVWRSIGLALPLHALLIACSAEPETPSTPAPESRAEADAVPAAPGGVIDSDIDSDGEALYGERCALCHDQPQDYVPARAQLALRSADSVIRALTQGSMVPHVQGLDAAQIERLAVYVTGKQPTGSTIDPDWRLNACSEGPRALRAGDWHWNGWARGPENTRYQPDPGLSAQDIARLRVKWAFAYPSGRHNSQPTLIGDQVLVSGAPGRVYSLDRTTGCTHWVYDPDAGVRATIPVGVIPGSSPARYAAFIGTTDRWVHAVDVQTGERLWKTQVGELEQARVTAGPAYHDGTLYVPLSSFEETAAASPDYRCCQFRGNVVALDAGTGEIRWRTHVIDEAPRPFRENALGRPMLGPAGAAIWSTPSIDPERGALYVGTGDSYTDVVEGGSDAIVAMSLESGEILWKNQVTKGDSFLVGCWGRGGHANCPEQLGPDFDFGSATVLREAGGHALVLAGQKSGVLYAMDRDAQGAIVWQRKLSEGSALGGIQWGFAADDTVVYVPISDLAVRRAEQRRPGLTALRIADGEPLWHVPSPACEAGRICRNGLSAAISVTPDAVFAASIDGVLRAHSTDDGSVLWEFDSTGVFESVNGIEVRGGQINATGPTLAGGMLFVNSGYGGVMNAGRSSLPDGQDGNVLLAFSVDGE